MVGGASQCHPGGLGYVGAMALNDTPPKEAPIKPEITSWAGAGACQEAQIASHGPSAPPAAISAFVPCLVPTVGRGRVPWRPLCPPDTLPWSRVHANLLPFSLAPCFPGEMQTFFVGF